MELGVIAMKEYSTLLRSPEEELHYQVQFRIIPRTPLWGREFYPQ